MGRIEPPDEAALRTLASELLAFDSRMQIAVISANHQHEVIDRARAAGAAFLAKPITEKALSSFFETVVKQRNLADKQ